MTYALLDDRMYDDVLAFATGLRSETGPADRDLSDAAEAFLTREARLLDDRDYAAWLELFTDDALYWVPSSNPIEDPRQKVSYLLDDKRRLEDRVALFDTGWAHAQIPESRTQRILGRAEAWREDDRHVRVRIAGITHDWRRDELISHPLSGLYRLRDDGAGSWQIAYRVIQRLACDGPIANISYIL